MANKAKTTKPHTSKKGHKKGKGLSGAGQGEQKLKAVKESFMESAIKPAGVLVGLVGASLINQAIDKIEALKVDPAAEGQTMKKLAKPVILIGAGGAAIFFTHGKKGAGNDFINGAGYGLAGGGVLTGVKVFMDKSLVEGLGNVGAPKEVDYYKKQAAEMAALLETSKFNPALPEAPRTEAPVTTEEPVSGPYIASEMEDSGTIL